MPGKLSIAGAVASAQVGGQIIGYLPGVRCRLQFVDEVANAMRRAWAMAKGGLAALALVGALGAAPAAPAAAQEEGRTVADAPSRKVIRTKRMRVPADLFERDAVFFKRALVEAGGTIRADGHNLDLYGIQLVRRNRICTLEGARWARGQRASIAMRGLLEGQSISCSFIAAAGSPKAMCRVGDTDVAVAPQPGLGRAGRGRHRRDLRRSRSLSAAQEGRHLGRRAAVIWPMVAPAAGRSKYGAVTLKCSPPRSRYN
jgi:hypothetical protein